MKRTLIFCLAALTTVATSCATHPSKTTIPACCCSAVAPADYTDKSVYQLDSTWTSDADKKVHLGVLRGKPQVVAMFFASCQFTCPLTVNDMKNVEAALPETLRTNVGFTLISFDSKRDTSAALHTYRVKRELSAPTWTLLRGEPDNVRELAALLGVVYKEDANGDFAHSNLITVLNGEGEIIFQQPGVNIDPKEIVSRIEQMTN
jgi:protein SCO1/2